jgi:prolyl 3-hydroxylase /prolyl 3,4-dihydroxylase
MAPPDEDSDPAVFQSKAAARQQIAEIEGEGEGDQQATNGGEATVDGTDPAAMSTSKPSISYNGVELEFDASQLSPSDFDTDSEGGDEDDGPLIVLPAGFNQLLLVLRDPGVMRFVKYVSHSAQGSRWDVAGEWDVGQLEEEEEEEEEEGKGESEVDA